ncbi:MAG: hypothetical protein BEN19_05820 [Epulopiscium sp. Nuni2H_MBin003]|nr:MAG: hypothetical protein BEN19_05820 [Epulopiscium sp. Nuni2H_MBin003]
MTDDLFYRLEGVFYINSYERVMAIINGDEYDRVANVALVMLFAANQIGVPYGEYVRDYKKLTAGVLYCYEKFGLDTICVVSDPMREAEGFGANVIIEPDNVPHSQDKLIKQITDIKKLKVGDPSKSYAMNDRLMAVRFLSERVGLDAPIIGWVEGAVAEACDLMDMSSFMMNLIDEPDAMQELLDICVEQAILFAKAQIDAGANIIGVGDAAASLIGPYLYEEFALPCQQKIIKAIKDYGAKTKLHICGNLNPVLDLVSKTGADIVDIDYMVDMQKACEHLDMVVCGNYDPVTVLLQGNTELVQKEVMRCLEFSKQHRIMVSAGCEVPKFTPVDNMLTVRDIVNNFR